MIRDRATRATPLALGAITALVLGGYATIHEPTGRELVLIGFDSAASWKSALASVTAFLFLVQLSLGLRITGRLGPRTPPPSWAAPLHRLIGTLAFGFSIPVVFHCIWAVGYPTHDARLVAHALAGCVAYGLYVTKVLTARRGDGPEWALPVVGAFLGLAMLTAWWASAWAHYTTAGPS